MSCYTDNGKTEPGIGMANAESESIRIRHFKECIEHTSYKKQSYSCAQCRTILPSNAYSAPGETQRILNEAVACPIYRKAPYSSVCTSVSGDNPTYISVTSINSITEIAIPIRNIGSSENTSRKKVAIQNATSVPFFRQRALPPICIPISQRVPYIGPQYGQPGVPQAPLPPCILGNRRVDYSTGR